MVSLLTHLLVVRVGRFFERRGSKLILLWGGGGGFSFCWWRRRVVQTWRWGGWGTRSSLKRQEWGFNMRKSCMEMVQKLPAAGKNIFRIFSFYYILSLCDMNASSQTRNMLLKHHTAADVFSLFCSKLRHSAANAKHEKKINLKTTVVLFPE